MFDASRARRWTGFLLVPLLGVLTWGLARPLPEPSSHRRPRAKRTARTPAPKAPPALLARAPTPKAPPPPAPIRRTRPAPSPRALRLHQLGEKLGTLPPPTEDPCRFPPEGRGPPP